MVMLVLLSMVVVKVAGHGSMVEPPSRGVMHFYGFPSNPPNYNWMEGFCGGKAHQWGVNGGKYDLTCSHLNLGLAGGVKVWDLWGLLGCGGEGARSPGWEVRQWCDSEAVQAGSNHPGHLSHHRQPRRLRRLQAVPQQQHQPGPDTGLF